MKLTYEKKNEMTFIGYHTEIKPDEGYIKCPEFWDREFNAKYARLWQTMKPETPVEKAILANGIGMYAICAESENGLHSRKSRARCSLPSSYYNRSILHRLSRPLRQQKTR